jgi:diguanylate cyclase (GGDEF)-like protein/PAS domain S-box-containing protein
MGWPSKMKPQRRSIVRQAALRLIVSLGLFVLLLSYSSYQLYTIALQKSADERTADLAEFYQSRLFQQERDWELQAQDFKIRIEVTRLLQDPKNRTTNLQAFMTVQGTNRQFQHLLIQNKLGVKVFDFGSMPELQKIPSPANKESGWYQAPGTGNTYRYFVLPIWLGEGGMGRMTIFYQIDNALLFKLSTPGIVLTAKNNHRIFASSLGQANIEEQISQLNNVEIPTDGRDIAWNNEAGNTITLHVNAPLNVLFSRTELALSAATVPIIDGLILWFTLGFWLMRKAHRIKSLDDAIQEFTQNNKITDTLNWRLKFAKANQHDEISDVSDAIVNMTQQTLIRENEREVIEQTRRLWAMVFNNCNDAIIITDQFKKIILVNSAFTSLTGFSQEDVKGKDPISLTSGLYHSELHEGIWQKINEVGYWAGELKDHRKNGTPYYKWITINQVRDAAGLTINYVSIFQDITERKKTEEILNRSEIKFRTLYDSSSDAVILLDGVGFLDCNQSALKLFGFNTKSEFCLKQLSDLSPLYQTDGINSVTLMDRYITTAIQDGSIRFDWIYRRVSGEEYPAEVQLSAMELEGKIIVQATVRDITKRIQSEKEIERLAFYDPLTNLPNRRLLMDRLQHTLSANIRDEKHGAILFIDLDNFKTLNDTKGHSIGDLLLIEVSKRLKSCVREEDTVARLGGDEFVLLLENLSTKHNEASAHAERVAHKILQELNRPYLLSGIAHYSSPSIGVTMFCDYTSNVETLIKHADTAMYQAKKAGRNTIRFYDPAVQEMIETRSDLEDELRNALEKQQLLLYYQVQVNEHGYAIGAEALLRWNHPIMGMIPPTQFIPLAEETGLIVPIGFWVLQTACAQLQKWKENPNACDLVLAVNVSVRQFHESQFVSQLGQLIKNSRINPNKLKLEITESIVVNNIETTIRIMEALELMGVQFSMDDFGTGYSSLNIIKRLPLHQLKIDQSFTRDLIIDISDRIIVRTIIAMARSLNLDVIAEGVETKEQYQLLTGKGCYHFQGYFFGRPVPIHQFESELSSHQKHLKI